MSSVNLPSESPWLKSWPRSLSRAHPSTATFERQHAQSTATQSASSSKHGCKPASREVRRDNVCAASRQHWPTWCRSFLNPAGPEKQQNSPRNRCSYCPTMQTRSAFTPSPQKVHRAPGQNGPIAASQSTIRSSKHGKLQQAQPATCVSHYFPEAATACEERHLKGLHTRRRDFSVSYYSKLSNSSSETNRLTIAEPDVSAFAEAA